MLRIDINNFIQQVEQKKKQLLEGFAEARNAVQPLLIERMKINIESQVYKAYTSASTSKDKYQRTNKLINSVTTRIEEDVVYVYVDDSVAPYAHRVQQGNEEIPYDYPFVPFGSTGDFREPRDWVQITYNDLVDAANTGNSELVKIIITAIRKYFR